MKKKVLLVLLGLLVLTSCGPAIERTRELTGPTYCGRPSTVTVQAVENAGEYGIDGSFVLTPPSGCDLPVVYCVGNTWDGTFSCVKIDD